MKIQGKYTSAEVFAPEIEESARTFVQALCDHPAMEGIPIAQMPDVHAGRGCNVGTAYPVRDYVNPDHVGVDIGCTISMHRLSKPIGREDLALFDHRIREAVPTGVEINGKKVVDDKELFRFLTREYNKACSAAPDRICDVGRIDERFVSAFLKRIKMQEVIFYKSLGSLGGGNHFIEYGEDRETGEPWLTIHTGSRNLGVKVAGHWHTVAANPRKNRYPGFLEGDGLCGYLADMVIAQAYARFNHLTIRDRIVDCLRKFDRTEVEESLFTTHNYISVVDTEPMLRKGAIDASEGQRVCIPFNMRDGIAIAVGRGNAEWNYSAPHGAGRLMSRTAAKQNISMEEFRRSMDGVFSTSVCEGTLDESPQAYKPAEQILGLVGPTVEIVSMIEPKLNMKDVSK